MGLSWKHVKTMYIYQSSNAVLYILQWYNVKTGKI